MYSDIYKPVLCVKQADIDIDGSRYSCIVKWADRKKASITTAKVTLKVCCSQLDMFKEGLASIYLAQPEVPQDSWPPVSNKTYINLALIKQQAIINYDGEYARLTIQGDLDHTLENKEKINYKNIFDGLRSGSLLIIEGRPGSGKTTLVHKITRDWAASEVQGPMRLVLLVSLRVLNNWKKNVTLEDILQLLNLNIRKEVIDQRNGKGVCFIFDGLDEFSPLEGENNIVHQIINKKYLPKSIVIAASRPAALVTLRQRANKVIEVVGFSKDQIVKYVENYPFSNGSKITQLKSYLLSHPNVLHMCYLPIHAAMIAFLFEVMGNIPCTETEIYKHFTRFTLIRSLSKHKGQNELENVDTGKLSGEEKELFDTICKFAIEKTILKKQALDQDEMKLCLQSKDIKDISLGLVTVDRTAGLYGFKNIYTFLRLTYQEYLAAHHISTLSNEDQLKLIKQYGDTDHMQIVWKFYCGLINFKGYNSMIEELLHREQNITLSDIQCAYESQQPVASEYLVKKEDAHIFLEDKYLTITDLTALGYLLKNSPVPVTLTLINCNSNTEFFSALLKEIEEKHAVIRSLQYESDEINLESTTKLLSHQKALENLRLITQSSAPHCLDHYDLTDIVSTSFTNLRELSLRNVQVGPKTLSNVMQSCEELRSLRLFTDDIIDEDEIGVFVKMHSRLKNLEKISYRASTWDEIVKIDISHTEIHEVNLPSISDHDYCIFCVYGIQGHNYQTLMIKLLNTCWPQYKIKSCNRMYFPKPKLLALQGFYSSCDQLDIISRLAGCVTDFSALERLVLRDMYIEHIVEVFADKLVYCTNLRELDISDNGSSIKTKSIRHIFARLRKTLNLQRLICSGTYIGKDAHVLASCLHYWPKLQELYLKNCSLKEEGVRAIADNLKHCCTELTKLDLGHNNIHTEIKVLIKYSLQSHKYLTKVML